MSRSSREAAIISPGGSRNLPIRRGRLTAINGGGDATDQHRNNNNNNNYSDLLSNNHNRLPDHHSQLPVSIKLGLGRLSLGSPTKTGFSDDLLSSTDSGKHDYDWLLTPPETPLFPASDGNELRPAPVPRRTTSSTRSASTIKSSRLSVSQSESNHAGRPSRSSSVTRPSVSTFHYSSYSNKSASILNTSSASVSSYIRPSTPGCSRSSSTARPSSPSSRPTLSRPSTPTRTRPGSSVVEKTRPSQTSRPSTPSSRPQIQAGLNSPGVRSTSRPSTPTRRSSAPSLSPAPGPPSTPIGLSPSTGRNSSSVSRPSSPSPRVHPAPQPIVLPDFPLDTPPNLRTTLPDRPLSAGRSRPGAAVTAKGNVDSPSTANHTRRQPSPVATRGRLTEPSARSRNSNGRLSHVSEPPRTAHVSEMPTRKPLKTSTDNTGFGRTISKRSLDMAIKHMDIRSGTNGSSRSVSGSTLFPQSIRSTSMKNQPSHAVNATGYVNGHLPICGNGDIAENDNGNYIRRSSNNGIGEDRPRISEKLTDFDIYESSRYDAILLKEDLKNTSWLHSLDDKTDQESIFDNGFETLPEPFGPL